MATYFGRSPFDERLPDGRTVDEAYQDALGGGGTTRPRRFLNPTVPWGGSQAGSGGKPWGGTAQQPVPRTAPPVPPMDTALPDEEAVPLPGASAATPPTPEFGTPQRYGQFHTTPWGEKVGSLPSTREGHITALEQASAQSPITETPGGWEVAPRKKPSRFKQALIGMLEGAVLGAQGPTEGAALRALGGAGAGATTGAIAPGRIQELTRYQELQRERGLQAQDIEARKGEATIGGIEAETQRRLIDPYIEQLKIQQASLDRATEEASRNERARRQNETSIKVAEIRARQARNPQIQKDDAGNLLEIVPGENGAAATTRVIRKGSRASSNMLQADALYQSASKDWDDAVQKWKDADALDDQIADLTSQQRAVGADRDLIRRRDQLRREADGLHRKVLDNQNKGDALRAEAQAIQAAEEANTPPSPPRGSGRAGSRSTAPQGQYRGKAINRTDIPEAARLKGMTPAQFEQWFRAQGGVIQ